MATYLITGGCGFIGSNIAERLVALGETVRILDNLSTGARGNIESFADNVTLVEGDVCNPQNLREAAKGVDIILHQAALPSVPRSFSDPVASNHTNIDGTVTVLSVAREVGVKRVVYASSSSVYGDNPTLPKKEDMQPTPISPYAVGKLAGENYCQVFSKIYGLSTIILRYFNVYGPRQDPASEYSAVIPKFLSAMLRGNRPTIYGDGQQSRGFTYVADVVEANLLAAAAGPDVQGVFNVSVPVSTSVNELAEMLNRLLENELKPIYADPRPGDVKHSAADISRAQQILGYSPKFDFQTGLRQTVECFIKTQRADA